MNVTDILYSDTNIKSYVNSVSELSIGCMYDEYRHVFNELLEWRVYTVNNYYWDTVVLLDI